jgi:hypothetical protein
VEPDAFFRGRRRRDSAGHTLAMFAYPLVVASPTRPRPPVTAGNPRIPDPPARRPPPPPQYPGAPPPDPAPKPPPPPQVPVRPPRTK